MRNAEAVRQGKADRHGLASDKMNGLNIHVYGAAGEIAAAIALDLGYTPTVNTFKKGGDLGTFRVDGLAVSIQVRTRSQSHYELIVRGDDRNDDVFVLVTGEKDSPQFRVVGWIVGRDAKKSVWRQTYGNRPGAYFVPHRALNKMTSLKKHLKNEKLVWEMVA